MTASKTPDKARAKPGEPALNQSVSTDRGSVVNQGSEGDEVLSTPAASTDDKTHPAARPGEADQSGTRGARGKPGGTIEVRDGKIVR